MVQHIFGMTTLIVFHYAFFSPKKCCKKKSVSVLSYTFSENKTKSVILIIKISYEEKVSRKKRN